ncbi:nidogen-2 precursor, partial [Paramuricea clavata]
IDECNEICKESNAKCINTDGSYECQCITGYILAADGHTCIIGPCNSNTCKAPRTRCMKDEQDSKRYQCFCPNNKIGDDCQYL